MFLLRRLLAVSVWMGSEGVLVFHARLSWKKLATLKNVFAAPLAGSRRVHGDLKVFSSFMHGSAGRSWPPLALFPQ